MSEHDCVLIGHLDTFFGDTRMQSLCSLLNWVPCFVSVELFYALAPQVQSDRPFVNILCYSRIMLLSTLLMGLSDVQNPLVLI